MQFPIEFRKVWALTKKDMYNWSTYKSQAITTILGALIGVASWGFIASYRNVTVPEYNADYVSYLLIGILVSNVILPISTGLQTRLNPWTIETVLMSGIKTQTFVIGTVAWNYILSVLLFIPEMAIGVFIFKAHLVIDPVSAISAIVISSVIVFSISVITTGIRIVTKVTDPVTWSLMVGGQLLSGMTFPIQHLNDYVPGLSNLSWILPQTWIYHIVRLSTLDGASILQPTVAISFGITIAYALVLLPLSLWIFRWGLIRAKKDGALGWY
ncbi:MAG: ABC transporter permease [Conexivisphaerales archaeon]